MENQNQENQGQPQTINIQIPSANNIASRRSLIPASFALAIFCFFFTFCDLKCVSNGQKIASVTGIELVTGKQLKDDNMMSGEEEKGEEIPSSIWAILALGAAVVGLGVFLIKEKRESLVGTGAGAIGAGSLLILQFVFKSAMEEKGEGQLEADFQMAYWVALFALGVAGLISYFRVKQYDRVALNYPSAVLSTSDSLLTEKIASQIEQQKLPQYQTVNHFDISEWLIRNKRYIIGISVVILFTLALFWLYKSFLSYDPERDGKSAAMASCACKKNDNASKIKAYSEFVKSFKSYNFKNPEEARNKLNKIINQINKTRFDCDNKVMENNVKLRNRYIKSDSDFKKVEEAFNAYVCNSDNERNLKIVLEEAENTITSMGGTIVPEIPLLQSK